MDKERPNILRVRTPTINPPTENERKITEDTYTRVNMYIREGDWSEINEANFPELNGEQIQRCKQRAFINLMSELHYIRTRLPEFYEINTEAMYRQATSFTKEVSPNHENPEELAKEIVDTWQDSAPSPEERSQLVRKKDHMGVLKTAEWDQIEDRAR